MLEIKKIRMDGGTQPRAYINESIVAEYAEEVRNGAVFPDVIVFFDGSDYWLADGFHRVRAYKEAGKKEIGADIKQGTRRDAVLFAVGANASHGVRRTNEDKRRAVMTLLSDAEWGKWSDREIARRCAVSDRFVNSLRPVSANASQITTRKVERGGTTYVQNTAHIGRRSALPEPEPAGPEPEDIEPDIDISLEDEEASITIQASPMEDTESSDALNEMTVNEMYETIRRKFSSVFRKKELKSAVGVLIEKLSVWSEQL